MQAAILKEMQAVGKRSGLASMEIISGVILADEEWTPQNVSTLVDCLLAAANKCLESGDCYIKA